MAERTSLASFAKTYLAVVAFFAGLSLLLAALLHWALVYTLFQVYFWVGFTYACASLLAWTGFGNLYRYSPTLFIGSRGYRRLVVERKMWLEGRDDASLLVGLSFAGALMGLALAFYDPLFIAADLAVLAAVLVVLRSRRPQVAHA